MAYRKTAYVAATMAALSLASAAKATVIETFIASGIFDDSNLSKLGGTITIDETTGVVDAVNLTVSAISKLPNNFYQFPGTTLRIQQGTPNDPAFVALGIPGTSLIGYMGGSLYSETNPPPNANTSVYGISASGAEYRLISGSLTPQAAGAVPEPASWALMVGGFGLVGSAMRRRQRTNVRLS